ncbi:SDR family NAD(P)-dependent oxidoreductase [Kiloniella sp. b19]|uniref:SDR family NAD(P)-dependent oxidoreductase n=1 Tax=Kiloniella sp. GXU_MW_B19 TaxID=3141326 RepID=UPI0031D346C0
MLFTGGTDGMGKIAVERFAEMGANICLFGRNPEKTQGVIDTLSDKGYKGQLSLLGCDMNSLSQVRRAADRTLDQFEKIDYLINCAGINAPERTMSSDGYEMNFAVNYLGPFLLTELLLDRIKMTPSACILHVASATQEVAHLNFDDLQLKQKWSLLTSYAQAKLCLIMHGRDVARRLHNSSATINCLNPGYIRSNIGRYTKGPERLFMQLFGGLAAPTWVGAERIVTASLDKAYRNSSGCFIYEDMLLAPNPLALDDSKVARLMDISRELTGLTRTTKAQ